MWSSILLVDSHPILCVYYDCVENKHPLFIYENYRVLKLDLLSIGYP